MAVLDLTKGWRAGDNYLVLDVLGLPMSEYLVSNITLCCNALADELVARVVVDLDRWEAAKAAQTAADLTNPENKTLIKADVLSWAVGAGGAGTAREMASAADSVRRAFASCPYVPQTPYGGATTLLRS